MVSLGLTTWAESPEPTRSDSHAWSAHPNFDLLTSVAGIRPRTPGFKTVTIEVHLGDLQHIEAAMPQDQADVIQRDTVPEHLRRGRVPQPVCADVPEPSTLRRQDDHAANRT